MEEKYVDYDKKYNLNDFFNDTFQILKPVVKKSYIPIFVLLLPISLLMGLSILDFYKSFFTTVISGEVNPLSGQFPFSIEGYFRFIGISLFSSLLYLIVSLYIMEQSARLLTPNRPFIETKKLLTSYLGKILLAGLFMMFIIIGVELLFFLFIFLLTLLTKLISILSIILIILVSIVFIAALIWMTYCWILSPYLIVFEDAKAWQSLKSSISLVKNNWWRYFGISLLFALFLSFAANLITSPIIIFGMMPSLSDVFVSLGSIQNETEILYSLADLLNSRTFGLLLGFSIFISYFLQVLLLTCFRSLFYMDLTHRKKEAELQEEPLNRE